MAHSLVDSVVPLQGNLGTKEDQEEDQEEHYKMTGPGSQVLASIDIEMVDSHLGHQFHNTRKLHRTSYYRRPLLHSMMN